MVDVPGSRGTLVDATVTRERLKTSYESYAYDRLSLLNVISSRFPTNQGVVGSIPASRTNLFDGLVLTRNGPVFFGAGGYDAPASGRFSSRFCGFSLSSWSAFIIMPR